jgi:hypothetical protein
MSSHVFAEKVVVPGRSPWTILNYHNQNSNEHAAAPPNLRLEQLCRTHVSFLTPDREGRKVFKKLDLAGLQQSVCVHTLNSPVILINRW